MSLWRNRRRIASAVAGELSAGEEAALRAHLSSCEACRAHYDLLTMTARASRGTLEATGGEHERTLAQVLLSAQTPVASRARPQWVWRVAVVGAFAAVLAVVWLRPSSPAVQLRGGGEAADAQVFSVRVYAKRDDGPVRLVADFPSAGEAHVTEHDWVQFKAGTGEQVSGQREGDSVQVFELARSTQLTKGRWQVFVSRPPLAERVPAGVLWVE